MNIKSLLIGSAAALAAVSGAQAADAIVAAEPEPMEYVRVCDAFGTGYFYIPGTETCLQISGYVRFQWDVAEDAADNGDWGQRTNTRGYISLDSKTDTELGTLTGHIDLQIDSRDMEADGAEAAKLDGAWIALGGFKAGYFYGYWDKGINGETDVNDSGFSAIYNAVSYTYEGGAFSAGVALESFNNDVNGNERRPGNSFSRFSDDWGLSAQVSGAFGPVSADLLGSYDFDAEDGAIRVLASADVGPGQLQGFAVWSSGPTRYWDAAEWSVAASYKAQISEKFAITPGVQYWSDRNYDLAGSPDAWKAGVTLDYNIVSGLDAKVSVQYQDDDLAVDSNWNGFLRLQRTF